MEGLLAAAGAGLLKGGGGWLLDKAKPWLSKISNWMTGKFSSSPDSKSMGNTSIGELMNHGINKTMNGINDYAQSDWVKRKLPMLVGPGQKPHGALSEALGGFMEGVRRGGPSGPHRYVAGRDANGNVDIMGAGGPGIER